MKCQLPGLGRHDAHRREPCRRSGCYLLLLLVVHHSALAALASALF